MGLFAPTGLVLVTLASLLAFAPVFQGQINARWAAIADVTEPSRILLGDIQASLAQEMASVGAYVLTEEPLFAGRYRDLRAQERRRMIELGRLALIQSPEVIAAYRTLSTTAEAWHGRATEEEMLAGTLESAEYVERIASEHLMWERLLTTSNDLRDVLLAEENRVRTEIIQFERARRGITTALVGLALLAALAAAWMGKQIQRLRLQAEQRGRELNSLMDRRAHLIRGVTHDVKNPLGVISGYAELLEAGILDESASRNALSRIRDASRSAVHLIDDLLELSLAESGELRLQFEPLDLREQLEMVASEHAVAAAEAGLELTAEIADPLPCVTTDGLRIRQIMGNLLTNAIKYTPAGGRILLAAAAASGNGEPERIIIDVTDTGRGIPEDKLEEIFREFTRLEPGAERGTGLGLTISRRIARILGGEITVKSESGSGSTFTFLLPLQPPPERLRTASATADRQAAG